MAIVHLDTITLSADSVKNIVKIGGSTVNEAYFTRNIIKIVPSPSLGVILVVMPFEATYVVTNNQASTADDVYIIDTVDAVAPTSLLDLAAKLAVLIKV
jgi:hypothetical protein